MARLIVRCWFSVLTVYGYQSAFSLLIFTHVCVGTGGQCVNSYQCCNPGEQCLVSEKLNTGSQLRSRFGQCLNLETFMKAYEAYEKEKTFGFKKSGDACDDSTECADQCCREVKKGRFGSVTRACGKPGEYTCIWRKFTSPNDIFGY